MKGITESNDFIFVKSRIETKTNKTSGYGGAKGQTIEYEPSCDDEEEWTEKTVKNQIRSTVARMVSTDLKDTQRIYVVLGLNSTLALHKRETTLPNITVFDKRVKDIIKNLSASFVAYLNVKHTRLLVSCPLSRLLKVTQMRKGCNSRYYSSLKRISPLTFQEQVTEYLLTDTEWQDRDKTVLIQLIPNLSPELKESYTAKIIDFLAKHGKEPIDTNIGMIMADLNKDSTAMLLEASNFVFQVSEIPEGVAQQIQSRKRAVKRSVVESAKSDFESNEGSLPWICLLDSGVSKIPELAGLVEYDGFHVFHGDFEDGAKDEGHGTPIACLATFGDELLEPKTRIFSYKIFSESHKKLYIRAYEQAINKYSPRTRIFLSSINFKQPSPYLTSQLDHYIQQKNVCFVISAGNIRKINEVFEYAMTGTPCVEYVQKYPIEDPASAVNIIAVGAISKRQTHNSISKENELAPFTTCGVTQETLHDCRKPEVVQNGGNLCKDRTVLGLESFDKTGKKNTDKFVGTSFASPLLARNLAEIEAKYGDKIKNVETLKAIALASTRASTHICMGFGETSSFLSCDDSQALAYAEGEIPLKDKISEKNHYKESKAYIRIKVPTGVSCVELFIVHSDNNYMTTEPCLNTYMKVYAHKEGNETTSVKLTNSSELRKKSHMKVFMWKFARTSMQGIWTFTLIPDTAVNMLPEHQKNTTVRYGCAIRLTSRELPRTRGSFSLMEKFRMSNRRYMVR